MRVVVRLLLACLAAFAVGSPVARGGDDSAEAIRQALARAASPVERINLLPRLVALGNPVAATILAERLRTDPDVAVRAAAARALGVVHADNALGLLLDAALGGGPRTAREAVAKALARRPGGAARVVRALDDARTSDADAALLLLALASFRDPVTLAALVAGVASSSRELHEAALRALSMRRDAREERLAVLARALGDARDTESTLAALDAAELVADPILKPMLAPLVRAGDPAVRESAAYLLERIRVGEEAAKAPPVAVGAPAAPAAPVAPADRYAPPPDDVPPTSPVPPPLPSRGRYDVVYVVDVTGSTTTTIEDLRRRMEGEMASLLRLGACVRVGVVAYRGLHGAMARRAMQILSPCYDLRVVSSFLERLDPSGVDERGAAVASALEVALDLTPWRWDARRDVHVLADSPCDRPAEAKATVSLHFTADGTRSSFAYVLRTRTRVPPEYDELAAAGGTQGVEAIK